MATVTARKRKTKPVREPKPIQVINDDDSQDRYLAMMGDCIERIKDTPQWRRVEKVAANLGDDREALLQAVSDEFTTLKWPCSDGSHAEMNGVNLGIFCEHHDGTRGFLHWSDLVDELEECTGAAKTTRKRRAKTVHANRKKPKGRK